MTLILLFTSIWNEYVSVADCCLDCLSFSKQSKRIYLFNNNSKRENFVSLKHEFVKKKKLNSAVVTLCHIKELELLFFLDTNLF